MMEANEAAAALEKLAKWRKIDRHMSWMWWGLQVPLQFISVFCCMGWACRVNNDWSVTSWWEKLFLLCVAVFNVRNVRVAIEHGKQLDTEIARTKDLERYVKSRGWVKED